MSDTPNFPVVGVGASAGGLEAYRSLLQALPAKPGAAFVFIQHLDPHHESRMSELLSRHTAMKVIQVEDGLELEANTVYVIPPNRFVKLVGTTLKLDAPVEERGIRLAVDYFFRSMAETLEKKAVGILLSGTGTDGTLGIREIKANGGMAMVQSPKTAQYDGMPRSAIATGVVDIVLPVEEMPDVLQGYIRHPYLSLPKRAPEAEQPKPGDFYSTVLSIIRTRTGHDFRKYKSGTLDRRIQRRMSLNHIQSIEDYVAKLREKPDEVQLLHDDLLIGVTRFFRDPVAWQALDELVLTPLVEKRADGGCIRAWIPGCASGEEAYTLAMLLADRIDSRGKSLSMQIFATDLSEQSIQFARNAKFPPAVEADVPKGYLDRYFESDGESLKVAKRLRDSVVFANQNLISDAPFSKLDLISCRNLMIYLQADVQRRLLEMFHFALRDGGALFLGPSETADRPAQLFKPLSKPFRIYRQNPSSRQRDGAFPVQDKSNRTLGLVPARTEQNEIQMSASDLARSALLEQFTPPSVCVNSRFQAQYFHGRLRDYLDFPSGEPSQELTRIVMPDLRSKVRGLLNKVIETSEPGEAICRNVRRNGHEVDVKLTAVPLFDGDAHTLTLLSFEDASSPRDVISDAERREVAREAGGSEAVIQQLEDELQATREDLQSTIEEMETANEELNASNEEVMSMNEELQSANEELETSREELQSLNEELTTLNAQLETQISEVEGANNDLRNLLTSTNIAVIFLDTDLCIRRYTPATHDVMRIIESDIGRPVEDLSARVDDPKLIEDSRRVMDKLQPVEAEVTNREGRHFIRRLQPYRTSENRIEGVVATFADVTNLREATQAVGRRERQQAAIAEIGRKALERVPLSELYDTAVGALVSELGVRFSKVLRLSPDRKELDLVSGVGWKKGLVGRAKVDATGNSQASFTLERSNPVIVESFKTEKRFRAPALLTDHEIDCGASVIIGPVSSPWGVLGAHDRKDGTCRFNIDDLNFMQAVANFLWLAIAQDQAEQELDAERRELQALADALPILIAVITPDERYAFVNQAFEVWGEPLDKIRKKTIKDLLGPDAYRQAKPHIDTALAGEETSYELTVELPSGEQRTNLVTYAPRFDQHGEADGFYAAVVDITDRKRDEERHRVISAELDHRVKNILATVASIARLSGRDAKSVEEYKAAFEHRVEALGRAHQTLAAQRWEGLSFRRLLEDELSPYMSQTPDRIVLKGPDLVLTPSAAQTLALVLHELTTNAVKYGALQGDKGQLNVSWSVLRPAKGMKMIWKEAGAKDLKPPSSNGFGSTVIGQVVRMQLNADVDMEYRKTGFNYALSIPAKYLRGTADKA